jgi:hypothetical protein
MKSLVVKHSIVLAGHKTSVSLEDEFWSALKDIGLGDRRIGHRPCNRRPLSYPDVASVRIARTASRGMPATSLPAANLFLHYTFDIWMARNHPNIPFERYADDAICRHCRQSHTAINELVAQLNASAITGTHLARLA